MKKLLLALVLLAMLAFPLSASAHKATTKWLVLYASAEMYGAREHTHNADGTESDRILAEGFWKDLGRNKFRYPYGPGHWNGDKWVSDKYAVIERPKNCHAADGCWVFHYFPLNGDPLFYKYMNGAIKVLK